VPPEAPEEVLEAGKQALKTMRADGGNGGDSGETAGTGDRYSPWRSLGAFRMGESE
jgi:hypothetical protein